MTNITMGASSLFLPTRQCSTPTEESSLSIDSISKEFSAPVGLFSVASQQWRGMTEAARRAFPPVDQAARLLKEIDPSRAQVWRDPTASGPVWLILPWNAAALERESLAAWIGFAPSHDWPGAEEWGPPCPAQALRAWGQSVADRHSRDRTEESESASILSATPRLTDRMIRQLRVSDPPERFQFLAANVMKTEMGVEAVTWVPHSPHEQVVVAGGIEGMTAEQYRKLPPKSNEEAARVVNRISSTHLPNVRRVAVVAADRQASIGWLLAINPIDGRPFSTVEVEILQPVAALIATQRSNARLYGDLKELLFGVIRALTSAIDAKDPYTSGHSERVARIAVRLGEELGMSLTQRGDLYLMGLLHDVGKIGIDDSVLKKPGRLTPEEYRQIQAHVRIGMHILSDLKKLSHLLPGVAHHHEALDGTGYPLGLSGNAIPLPARILAVADAFDAMSSSRPYRRGMTNAQIDAELQKGTGKQWDPRVISALFACRDDIDRIRQKGIGESLQQVVDDTLGRG
jgi:HD-GYP domain-containing protein (c-di-GMP phosphodiesterase class II)